MSLRDYFAAKAMPLAFQHLREAYMGDGGVFEWSGQLTDIDCLAEDCYALADAMLKARQA